MKNKTIINFVHSLILLPIVSVTGSGFGNIPSKMPEIATRATQVVLAQNNTVSDEDKVSREAAQILKIKADAIDSYYKSRGMPLAGYGEKMVIEAEKNDLDWRLLAAIAVRESTGGKFKCQKVSYSSFGWGSCKINFDSHDEEIEIVARNLGGNNPKTARYYAGKTVKGILQAYNPPTIVLRYAEQVMKIMDDIGPEEVVLETHANA